MEIEDMLMSMKDMVFIVFFVTFIL